MDVSLPARAPILHHVGRVNYAIDTSPGVDRPIKTTITVGFLALVALALVASAPYLLGHFSKSSAESEAVHSRVTTPLSPVR